MNKSIYKSISAYTMIKHTSTMILAILQESQIESHVIVYVIS